MHILIVYILQKYLCFYRIIFISLSHWIKVALVQTENHIMSVLFCMHIWILIIIILVC